MLVPGDLDQAGFSRRLLGKAIFVTVVKEIGSGAIPGNKIEVMANAAPVVIALDQNEVRDKVVNAGEPTDGFIRCSGTVDHVSSEDQSAGLPLLHEFQESFLNRFHAPERPESARRASADLIAEVDVRNSQPALVPVEQAQPAVQKDPRSDFRPP